MNTMRKKINTKSNNFRKPMQHCAESWKQKTPSTNNQFENENQNENPYCNLDRDDLLILIKRLEESLSQSHGREVNLLRHLDAEMKRSNFYREREHTLIETLDQAISTINIFEMKYGDLTAEDLSLLP